jgi:hypothetical protein
MTVRRSRPGSGVVHGVAASVALFGTIVAFAICAAAATAAPPLLTQFCRSSGEPDTCGLTNPHSVVTNQATGNVYVLGNNAISEYTPWGEFIRAFGGGVANGGAAGEGILTPGSPVVNSLTTTSKAFVLGMPIEGAGIASGTIVVALGPMRLSKPATAAATETLTQLTSPEAPSNVPTNELQRLTVTATGGTYNLLFQISETEPQQQTSTPIPYNASAEQLQNALEAIPGIGSGNVAVTSSNPGGESGVPGGPYLIEFAGQLLSDTNVKRLRTRPGAPALTGGDAAVQTTRNGASAPEVCTGSECREGVSGQGPGQIAGARGMAFDSTGDLYVYESLGCSSECDAPEENNRVQKFDASGEFLLMFGRGVDEGGGTPSNPGDICTAQDVANGDKCGGGIRGKGNGQFGIGAVGGELDPRGTFIATGPDGTVYVGGLERVQEFEPSGAFKGLLPDPAGVLKGEDVQSLAVNPVSGTIYLTLYKEDYGNPKGGVKEGVLEMSPAGQVLRTLAVKQPNALTTSGTGRLFVADGFFGIQGEAVALREFNSSGEENKGFAFEDGFGLVEGLADNLSCGISGGDLYAINAPVQYDEHGYYVSAYGSPPDPAVCPPPQVPPKITEQYATSVTTDGATVKAQINPNFWSDTRYHVEYGTGKCSEGGCGNSQPTGSGARLTTAVTSQLLNTAGVNIQGLEPDGTYHYRFVAESSGGGPVSGVEGAEGTFTTMSPRLPVKVDCPNQAFRTGASASQPDCRAFEMVSPVDKNGGDIGTFKTYGGLTVGAENGQRITYTTLRSFGPAESAPLFNQYLATRASTGWSTESISPPRANPAFYPPLVPGQFKFFSDDLCSAWLMQETAVALVPEAPAADPTLYRRDDCGGAGYELLTKEAPTGFGTPFPESTYNVAPLGASSDGSRSVFRAPTPLTSNACSKNEIFQTYETNGEGPLRLISVLPNGKANCTHSGVGTLSGNDLDFSASSVWHAVSEDGERVFWSTSLLAGGLSGQDGTNPGKLYLRVNATEPQSKVAGGKCTELELACTLSVSESTDSFFWGADSKGNRAIYSAGSELFEYDTAEEQSHLIAGETLGVAGMNEGASRVYFVSRELLTGGEENSEGAKAKAEEPNLYLYEAGQGFTFVGRLVGADLHNGPTEAVNTTIGYSLIAQNPRARSARVTPDGSQFVFGSWASLTGYDNADLNSGAPDAEVYLFDAGAKKLSCISCNPTDARPSGRALKPAFNSQEGQAWTSGLIPGWPGQLNPTRPLSADGNRLFFESTEALLPADTNGKVDVYEWERAPGRAACEAAGAEAYFVSAEGCISLISSGQSPTDAEFIDASSDGSDVFLATSASLLPQDPGLVDIYDARVDGGFPQPPPTPPACEGEACQGPIAPSNDPTPASSSYRGPGNVPAAKTKSAHKKKSRHKKHKKKNAKKSRAGRSNETGRAGR